MLPADTRSISAVAVGPSRNTGASGSVYAGQDSRSSRAVFARKINASLAGSPLAGKGEVFTDAGLKYGVDPFFLAAIAGAETSFGRTGNASSIKNPFGLGPGMTFRTWDEAIDYAAKNVAGPLYSGRDTIEDIGAKWAPSGAANDPGGLNNNWVRNVNSFYQQIAGQGPPGGKVKNHSPQGAGLGTALDAAGDVANAVTPDPIANVLGGIADILKFIVNPQMWIRVGGMLLGAAIMIAGIFLTAKSSDAMRPVGIALISVGFVWLWGSVKAVNPADMLKSLVGASG